MTILIEGERVEALKYYNWGWSFREITTALLDIRMEKIKVDMQREVEFVIAH